MRISLVLCTIALMAIERADCNLGDFFNNIPNDIGNVFTNVWNTVVTAIKHPVRIKRLGRAKTTSTTTARPVTKEPYKLVFATSPITIKYDLQHPSLRRLMLPVFTTPKWQSLEQWKKLQEPTFVWMKPGLSMSSTPEVEDNEIGSDQNPSRLNDEEALGVLMYIKK